MVWLSTEKDTGAVPATASVFVTVAVNVDVAPGATMLVGTLADAKSTVVGTYKYPRLNPKVSLARSTSKLGFDHHVSVPNPPENSCSFPPYAYAGSAGTKLNANGWDTPGKAFFK